MTAEAGLVDTDASMYDGIAILSTLRQDDAVLGALHAIQDARNLLGDVITGLADGTIPEVAP